MGSYAAWIGIHKLRDYSYECGSTVLKDADVRTRSANLDVEVLCLLEGLRGVDDSNDAQRRNEAGSVSNTLRKFFARSGKQFDINGKKNVKETTIVLNNRSRLISGADKLANDDF
jgi:hypothetical protein